MALLNLDDDDEVTTTAVVEKVDIIRETVTTTTQPATHMLAADESWSWRELRDYVVGEIEQRFGAFPRDLLKEKGIFDAFLSRWGTKAARIARYAFESCQGIWRGAPVSVNRFCKASDPYFAAVISDLID